MYVNAADECHATKTPEDHDPETAAPKSVKVADVTKVGWEAAKQIAMKKLDN